MRHFGVLLALSSAAFLLACGSEVTVTNGLATTSSSSGSSSSGEGNTTGGNPSGTSTGIGEQCGRSDEKLPVISLLKPENQEVSCAALKASLVIGETIVFSAVVVESNESTVVLDSCPPMADCGPSTYYLQLDAPGHYNVAPVGAFVRVSFTLEMPYDICSGALSLTNMSDWAGWPNPVSPDPIIWMAAGRGTYETAPESTFEIEAKALGCYPNEGGCRPKEDFSLRFSSPYGQPLDVPMGTSREWAQAGYGGSHVLTVRNVRSYDDGTCDEDHDWGYWIYGSEMLD